jgi:Putative ATPase subunit of terminase (gpP-like)
VLKIGFEFTWERPAKGKGFAWQETDSGEIRLVRVEGVPFESYGPLNECTGLFRTFAALDPEPVAMLKFANRNGLLGGDWDELALWREGIARLKSLVAAWDALAAEDWAALRAVLSKRPKALFQPGSDAKRAGPSELANAAVHLLYREVAGRIFGWTFGAWSRQQHPPVLWHQQTKRLVLQLVPPSLMDAMLLQFADAIQGGKRYHQCEACSRWFERRPGLARADRQTCSDSCRVKLYRLRQARARELHGEGWSAKRIAKELGSDVSTIKKWASKNKE